ncbi:hypothetical protein BJ684DRAFT_22135 [Piptocephalis cylindrospora]|uniref:Uncharacterized protein n=1 Tax=Piptocephalis cylindrospora TaxID=1907219 RepID=A0A4P9XYX6_9FUNG|nr:hypothetical protein BJ684DRAFT_22135 [Piptocephalis cylindrospora]|eukprot:RKP11312.1 hypothetical protein BJ684DRAFT_22135 [Piptocephalis cylindrospora]
MIRPWLLFVVIAAILFVSSRGQVQHIGDYPVNELAPDLSLPYAALKDPVLGGSGCPTCKNGRPVGVNVGRDAEPPANMGGGGEKSRALNYPFLSCPDLCSEPSIPTTQDGRRDCLIKPLQDPSV